MGVGDRGRDDRILPAFAYKRSPNLGGYLKVAYLFNIFIALMFLTATLKPAYQTQLGLDKYLTPDDLVSLWCLV